MCITNFLVYQLLHLAPPACISVIAVKNTRPQKSISVSMPNFVKILTSNHNRQTNRDIFEL